MAQEGGGVSTKGGIQGETATTLPKSSRFSQPTTQFSTQTLQGDHGHKMSPLDLPLGGHDSGADPNDSDLEEGSRADELRRARRGKQADPQPPRRRYTLEPGDLQDEILLTEVEDGAEEANESISLKSRTHRNSSRA